MSSYENEQKKLQQLWDEFLSDEEQEDPYPDCHSCDEYVPSENNSTSSDSDKENFIPKRRKQSKHNDSSLENEALTEETIENILRQVATDSSSDSNSENDAMDDLGWGPVNGKVMTRNRFEQLLSMWHFNNNEHIHNQCGEIDEVKLRPLLEKLLQKFQEVVIPGPNDKTVQIMHRQWLHIQCESILWKGARSVGNASFNVVFSLMGNLLDKGRTLYTDNYSTGVHLAKELLKRKTHLVGIVRSNRKLNCTEVINKKLKKHEIVARESNSGIVMMKWKDTRDVIMLKTKHTDDKKDSPPARSGN
ncbi:hypothetical protein NQ318_011172 [Aromia moschata]|uniref:PiggyBac transposable element-derived protein domain-containing protein n=1 Tax=Aromia moschata TaxID=1265417 RepID=A0AAV8YGK0_9CUCU|nr:hypothetical protein NQ318_011172 [Aromia moschata]